MKCAVQSARCLTLGAGARQRGSWPTAACSHRTLRTSCTTRVRLPAQPPLRVRRLSDQHDAVLAGDVVMALAGTSDRDLRRTIARAKEVGALTIGLFGSPNGTHGDSVDFSIAIPTERFSQQEDASSVVMHAIALALRERIELQAVSDANKAIAG